MKVRRVVTARTRAGKSVFQSAGDAPRAYDFVHIPGMAHTQIWATDATPSLAAEVSDTTPAMRSLVPPPGGTRFMYVIFPPDSIMQSPRFDGAAAAGESLSSMPGLAELFEPDSPGMHTTKTVDYGIVLDGEIWLELDDGAVQHVRQHDVIIQNGTRHAWRNRSSRATLMAFVLIGAE
jgi:hypothetical protein